MKFNHTTIFIFVLFLSVVLIVAVNTRSQNQSKNFITEQIPASISQNNMSNTEQKENSINQQSKQLTDFQPPIDRSSERVTKKYFGVFVSPKNSPVIPERFIGYHAGTDFETFTEEKNADVQIFAVCSGQLLLKEYANGYGGVAVQACDLGGQPITVVYGHLKLASIKNAIGENLKKGDILGVLGRGYSQETDGERKHLHLGFHKGRGISILGYVQSKSQLENWFDPCLYVCK